MKAEHAQAIRKRFMDYWEDRFPQYPVEWENEEFAPPDNAVWVKLNILPGTTSQAGLGGTPNNRRWRTGGVVIVQIFIPHNAGTGVGEELYEAIADCFQGVMTAEGVIFRGTSMNRVGQSGPWYQINASTGFQVDSYG